MSCFDIFDFASSPKSFLTFAGALLSDVWERSTLRVTEAPSWIEYYISIRASLTLMKNNDWASLYCLCPCDCHGDNLLECSCFQCCQCVGTGAVTDTANITAAPVSAANVGLLFKVSLGSAGSAFDAIKLNAASVVANVNGIVAYFSIVNQKFATLTIAKENLPYVNLETSR